MSSAWKSGDQLCVALLIVKNSAKWETYVKLIGILASLLISNHDLSICCLSLFNSSQITMCCNASCLLHHHARSHYHASRKHEKYIQSVLRAYCPELEVTWASMTCSLTMEDHQEALSVRGCWPIYLVTDTGCFNFPPYVTIVNII